MQAVLNTYLTFIPYTNFDLWDTKRYTTKGISSTFNIVDLGTCIKEENAKYKLFKEEETEFGILGVNNKEGIFDAYTQKGKEINQAYKKMQTGWLAYNPYRINVGSIGIKLPQHQNQYISPAYVVFSCLPNILPQYLFLLFKTQKFNTIINESTTGSVRQNLTIDILKKLKIPLPPLPIQQSLIDKYNAKINDAENLSKKRDDIKKQIENYTTEKLGISNISNGTKKGLYFVESSTITRWDIWNLSTQFNDSKHKIVSLNKVIKMKSGSFLPASKMIKGEFNVYGGNGVNGSHNLYEYSGKRIVIGRVGEYCGNVHLVDGKYWVTDNAFVVDKISDDVSYEFLEIVLSKLNLNKYRVLSAQPSISQSAILNLEMPLPNIEEQNEIIKQIHTLKKQASLIQEKEIILVTQATQQFETAIFN